jgi:2-oxoglutarate dehydrogenase E2 component (dihydrolipoamide succinyltransferase)
MTTTVTMPQLGESVVEGTIGKWLVQEGDRIERDQPVVEILTDKADSEVPSPVSGVVVKLLAREDDVVRVGAGLCEIDEASAGAGASKPSASSKAKAPPAAAKPSKAPEPEPMEPKPIASNGGAGEAPKTPENRGAKADAPLANGVSAPAQAASTQTTQGTPAGHAAAMGSPAMRKAAREQGIDVASLSNRELPKSTSALVKAPGESAPIPIKKSAFQVPAYKERPGDEVVPFSRRRRIIADHMVYSKLTSPHVVAVAECDLHETTKLRDKTKNQLKKEGVNLTYLAFVCAATVRALREFRELNARVLEDAYVLLRDINLGVAVDTPDGLVVPVIKNADGLTVRGIARAIDELAEKARDGKLTPDDLAGKTFTVSNPGKRGNLHGGAIISQPNVGILRVGEIKKRVVVVEKDGEDSMAIHPVMYMALSYDHRIVDGVHANSFLYRITEILEAGQFDV